MSVVTTITIQAFNPSEEDQAAIVALNKWLADRNHPPLKRVDDHYAGIKAAEIDVYGGAYNCLGDEEFAKFFLAQEWFSEENTVLVLDPQEGRTWVCRPGVEYDW